MINSENFIVRDRDEYKAKAHIMKKLNEYIEEQGIERSDILEFRTDENYSDDGKYYCKITISWWKSN